MVFGFAAGSLTVRWCPAPGPGGDHDVFEPEPAAIAALTKRVRESFDPPSVLNAGRMWADV